MGRKTSVNVTIECIKCRCFVAIVDSQQETGKIISLTVRVCTVHVLKQNYMSLILPCPRKLYIINLSQLH